MKNPYFSYGLGGYELDANIAPVYPTGSFDSYDVIAEPRPSTTYNPTSFVQTAIPKPVYTNAVTATMTFKTTVSDSTGVLPLATVKVNEGKYATTEAGIIQLPNISPDAIVTISYVGYKSFTAKASEVPARVVLIEDAEQLNEVVVTKPKKNNWLMWLGIAAVGAVVVSEVTKKEQSRTVRAKI